MEFRVVFERAHHPGQGRLARGAHEAAGFGQFRIHAAAGRSASVIPKRPARVHSAVIAVTPALRASYIERDRTRPAPGARTRGSSMPAKSNSIRRQALFMIAAAAVAA